MRTMGKLHQLRNQDFKLYHACESFLMRYGNSIDFAKRVVDELIKRERGQSTSPIDGSV